MTDTFDVVVIGAGASGEGAADYAALRGASVALVEKDLVGGSCAYWACIVQSNPRLHPTDHPRSSELLATAFREQGIDVRTGARAQRVRPRAGPSGEHVVEMADGTTAIGQVIALGIGRTPNVAGVGLETVGVDVTEGEFLRPDGGLRIAEGVYAVGDLIGREISTHLGHYEGELAVKAALGDDVTPDLRAVPRCVYTDPELAAVGLRVDQAREQGRDAVEFAQDLATTARGYVGEAKGHVTIVVDRADRTLVGAFIAGPGATEAIHEAVLAVKLRLRIDVLEDTIHAFPTTARAFGYLCAQASRELSGLAMPAGAGDQPGEASATRA